LLMMLAALSLRRVARRESESAGTAPASVKYVPPPETSTIPPLSNFPASPSLIPPPLITGRIPRRSMSRSVSDNPVLWRETRPPHRRREDAGNFPPPGAAVRCHRRPLFRFLSGGSDQRHHTPDHSLSHLHHQLHLGCHGIIFLPADQAGDICGDAESGRAAGA